MSKRIALIGVNYVASLVIDLFSKDANNHSYDLFDDDVSKLEKTFYDVKVQGNITDFLRKKDAYLGAVICIGDKHLKVKEQIGNTLRAEGVEMLNIVSKLSFLMSSAQFKTGIVVSMAASIGQRVSIGNDCMVWSGVILEHDVVLDNCCYIGPGAVLSGCVKVGACTMVGSNATILPEIKIGRDCKIGAGAVVTHDVPDGATVVGIPAKIISQ